MVKPFSPQTSAMLSESFGMVLYNHVGSSVAEDTGKDAQSLADELGIIVIAADRPGSGFSFPNPYLAHSLAGDYTHQIERSGKKIDREVDRSGLKRVIVSGRSAGGLAALALGSLELLPVTHVYAAEPVGWYDTTVTDGKQRFKEYGRWQQQLIGDVANYPDLVRPHDAGVRGLLAAKRLAAIGLNFTVDQFHNQNVWNQPLSRSHALTIAKRSHRVFLQIDFAEHSLVAREGDINQAKADISLERAWAAASSAVAPVIVGKVPNTVHSSFDNRLFMANRLRPIVAKALAA